MFSTKSLVSMLAVGGLMIAGSTASAAVVAVGGDGGSGIHGKMVPGDRTVSGNLDKFEFDGPFAGVGVSTDNPANVYGLLDKNGGTSNGGMGWTHHVDFADITAVQAAVDGMALRVSAWILSDPARPWVTQQVEGFKIEFYDNTVGLGAGELNAPGFVNDTENGFGLGLTSVTTGLTDGVWTQVSFTTQITDATVGFATLQEVRPVYFSGDWTGTDTDGRLVIDNWALEVFPDLATANATSIPTSAPSPGGYDQTDLSGDLNGDLFVGLDDLDVILNTWNNGLPPSPSAPSIPEPASLALLGLGSLAALRRR